MPPVEPSPEAVVPEDVEEAPLKERFAERTSTPTPAPEPELALDGEESGLPWEVTVESQPWSDFRVSPESSPEPPGTAAGEVVEDTFELAGASSFPAVVVYQGGKERDRYEMRGDVFLIGRASRRRPEPPHLDFGTYTDGKRVSRRHARIFQREGQYFIEDLGSEHGTWLNGEFLQTNVARQLADDDTISIAGVADLVFWMPGSGEAGHRLWDEEEESGRF
jgi:pSer/pThr/pTyr-binding forkhead associated (FHA) protein